MRDVATDLIGPRADGVSEVELDGQVCLYSPQGQQILVLNETASDVWRLSDGDLTLDEMVRLLAASYQTSAESIAADVLAAVRSFDQAGLFERHA